MQTLRSLASEYGILIVAALYVPVAARAQGPAPAPIPGKYSLSDLGRSASLVAGEQVCSILKDSRVACISEDRIFSQHDREEAAKRRQMIESTDSAGDAHSDPELDSEEYDATVPGTELGPAPWQVVPGLRGVVALSSGFRFTCALTREGKVLCWGSDPMTERDFDKENAIGLFGDGKHTTYLLPRPLNRVNQRIIALAARANGLCVRLADSTLQCINVGYFDRSHPGDGGRKVQAVSMVSGGACFLDAAGKVTCHSCEENGCSEWADHLGFSGPVARMSITCGGECPAEVVGLVRGRRLQVCHLSNSTRRCPELTRVPADLAQVDGSCGRTAAGEVYCWGARIGRGGELRTERIALPEPAVELGVVQHVVCARLASGKVACLRWNPLFGRIDTPLQLLPLPPAR